MAEIKHTGNPDRDHIKKLHGQKVKVIKAAEPNDEGYDVRVAKTVVELEDGTRQTVLNDEINW